MMKLPNRKELLVASAFASVLVVSSASALYGQQPAPMQGIGKMIYMADELGLEESQIDALQSIRSAHQAAFQAMGKARRENRRAMKALVASDSVDPASIEALAQAKGELHAQAFLERFALRQEIKAVLNEQQLEKVKRYRRHKRQARHHGW